MCNSVFMYLDGPVIMKRFCELLAPGGRLYLMVDLPAWHLRTILLNPQRIRTVIAAVIVFLRTLLGCKASIVYTQNSLTRLISENGLSLIALGDDGSCSFRDGGQTLPESVGFYPEKFLGMPLLLEVLASKNSGLVT